MIKKAITSILLGSLVLLASSCASGPNVPGDIDVRSQFQDRDPAPGNITGYGRAGESW